MRSRGDLALRGMAGAIGRGKMQVEGGHLGSSWEGFELQTLMRLLQGAPPPGWGRCAACGEASNVR